MSAVAASLLSRRWRRLAVLAVMCSALIVPAPRAGAYGGTILTVYPKTVHSGDTVYVSGANFVPGMEVILVVACPRWSTPDVVKYHNYMEFYPGPTVDDSGEFAGFPLRGFVLHGIDESPCQIEANYLDKTFVADTPAIYQIVPRSTRVPSPTGRIPVVVSVHPKSVRAGSKEVIAISRGWGGGHVEVTVQYSGGERRTWKQSLDYVGQGTIRFTVPNAAHTLPGPAEVRVRDQLSPYSGQDTASFTVVR